MALEGSNYVITSKIPEKVTCMANESYLLPLWLLILQIVNTYALALQTPEYTRYPIVKVEFSESDEGTVTALVSVTPGGDFTAQNLFLDPMHLARFTDTPKLIRVSNGIQITLSIPLETIIAAVKMDFNNCLLASLERQLYEALMAYVEPPSQLMVRQ